MSRDKLQLLSPLFLKYQSEYEKNPRSRVFAPLAEMYRKLGMTDKAMEILSQGIRLHPTYVMGYLGLAFCYFDIKQFNLAYTTLRPLVEGNRDNIRLQKLFADVCLALNHKEEALETYKYLLFINPRDREVAAQVTMLENLIESQYKPSHKPIVIPEAELTENNFSASNASTEMFDLDKLAVVPQADKQDFDDWLALDLSRDSKKSISPEERFDQWNLKKGPAPLAEINTELEPVSEERVFEIKNEKMQTGTTQFPILSPRIDFEEAENASESSESQVEIPLVTHTLVDLYCGQGHIEKALEVLEKILDLNPNDQRTINKIAEIKSLMGLGPIEKEVFENPEESIELNLGQINTIAKSLVPLEENTVTEEEGRQHLMNLIDETLGQESGSLNEIKDDPRVRVAEEKLNHFLRMIQKRALEFQSRL